MWPFPPTIYYLIFFLVQDRVEVVVRREDHYGNLLARIPGLRATVVRGNHREYIRNILHQKEVHVLMPDVNSIV